MFRSKSFKLTFVAVIGFLLMLMIAIPVMAQAPANDDRYSPTEIFGLPFTDFLDTTEATASYDDPYPGCWYQSPEATVWYQYTAMDDIRLMASTSGSDYETILVVYDEFQYELACTTYSGTVDFFASAGQTYFFMIGDIGTGGGPYYPPPGNGGQLEFNLAEYETPPPLADFWYWPEMPSSYDVINFYDYSYDPAGIGIESQVWDFGDGTTATGWSPTHQYAEDGEYLVQLDVVTFDGRSASTSRTVLVETHDVAITKFAAPNAASVGQTRTITAGVANYLMGETVEVTLYRSTSYGYEPVGWLTQYVPVRSGGRTTSFKFTYTFTEADAAVGKVTFRVYAQIIGANDALPADNEAIAKPTKVK